MNINSSHFAMNLFNAVVVFCIISSDTVKGSLVTVNQNGGYENVLIAFSPEIEDNQPVHYIEEIKKLIRSTSEKLYQATRGKFYLESVTILVPTKWGKLIPSKYQNEATNEHYKDAAIRVENPRSSTGNDLFTQQPRGCGQLGDFIHMTTAFLTESENDLDTSAMNLTREWARLRFGIFEENSLHEDPVRFPPTYYGSEGLNVTGCIHPYEWTYNPDSRGFTVDKGKKYKSSLMDSQFNTVEGFCDESADHRHNFESPTPHNALCRERSAWDVITSTSDFKAVTEQSNLKETTFKVVQPSRLNVVFVIDPAICSSGKDKMISVLMKALGQFFIFGFPSDYFLGILFANSHANLELAPIQGDVVQLVAKLREECKTQDPNSNDYLKALDKAREKINLNSATKKPGLVILIADGSNVDTANLISTTFASDIRNKLIDFYLITFSTFPTSSLLTPKEFGFITWYKIPLNDDNSWNLVARMKLNQIFTAIIDKYSPNFSPQKTLIHEAVHDVNGTGQVSSKIQGKFYLTIYSSDASMEIPSLKINGFRTMAKYHNFSIFSIDSFSTGSLRYSIIFPKTRQMFSVAIWFGDLINSNSMSLQGVVEVGDKQDTVMIPPLLLVYTSVKNPFVTATIRGPKNQESVVRLLPAGSHVKSDMKIFSRYFRALSFEPGLYEVNFTVSNRKENPSFVLRSIGSFYSFMTDKDVDQLPPTRITDLRVVETSVTEKTVTLAWTAPAKVDSYIYQCSTLKFDLEDNSKYLPLSNSGHPQSEGETEKHPVHINRFNTPYFCAIISEGIQGRRLSDRSNIVTVFITSFTTTPVTVTESNNCWPTKPSSRSNAPDIIIISTVIIGALIILAVVTVIIVCRTKKRRENPPFSGIILRDNPPLSEHDYPSVRGQQSSKTEKFDQPPPYPFEELHPQSFTQQNYDKNQNPIPAHWGNPPPYSIQSNNRAFTPNAPPMQE